MSSNPLLRDQPLPAFEDIRAEHVGPAIRSLLELNRARIREIENLAEPSFATVVEPMEDLQHCLTRAWSPVGHLNGVMNSEALREQYNACLPLLSEYGTDIGQSESLYQAYENVRLNESPRLDPVQREVLAQALRNFRLAGVGLPEAQKARFKEVMLELARLQSKFEENVLDATNDFRLAVADATQLDGINATIVEQASARAAEAKQEGWLFTLDQPTYVAIVTDGKSGELRRKFYEAWTTRASDQGPSANRFDNSQVMQEILRLRHEAGRLLDFPSYAEYALATRMAKSTTEVLEFLRNLARAAR
ncbi:MAG: M3 family metallopeptidase, partial [Steroidobacteraceae bacterium]